MENKNTLDKMNLDINPYESPRDPEGEIDDRSFLRQMSEDHPYISGAIIIGIPTLIVAGHYLYRL